MLFPLPSGLTCSLLFHSVSEIDGPQKGRMLYDSQVRLSRTTIAVDGGDLKSSHGGMDMVCCVTKMDVASYGVREHCCLKID